MKSQTLSLLALLSAAVAAPVTKEMTQFYSIGDWGSGGSTQEKVAQAMSEWAETYPPEYIFSLGDNFYEHGVTDVSDPLFETAWKEPYSADSLQVDWFMIGGNHDHYGNEHAQVAYTYTKQAEHWVYPRLYWTHTWEIDSHGTTMQIVALDTETLRKESERIDGIDEAYAGGEVSHAVHDEYLHEVRHGMSLGETLADRLSQYQWIEAVLASSTADWLIVIGHHPVYSSGSHGDTSSLVAGLKPMLEKYGVHAYMCGHDHNMQHHYENGVHYILSGSAGKRSSTYYPDHPFEKFFLSENGFTMHHISRSHFHTTFVNRDQEVVYEIEVEHTQRPAPTLNVNEDDAEKPAVVA